jgi:redox-sensitive bicupin YhaK (pirin superfamily)
MFKHHLKSSFMDLTYYPASERGHTNIGWLDSYHSFSFGDWYNPQKTHFGALRVLNDDQVAAGAGFGLHPHNNMEIVSIPLQGSLRHRDSTGREELIISDDVQIMSAGTGILHSEFNASKSDPVRFLQIWVLPKKRDIRPRYEQKKFMPEDRINKWQIVVSPIEEERGLWINQDARFAIANLEPGESLDFLPRFSHNLSYFFVIEGQVDVLGQPLSRRDALGVDGSGPVSVRAHKSSNLLAIEIPSITKNQTA